MLSSSEIKNRVAATKLAYCHANLLAIEVAIATYRATPKTAAITLKRYLTKEWRKTARITGQPFLLTPLRA
jgi:hypothetical protein